MVDYTKMYNDLEHELVGLFKSGLTPKSVEIIDDITCAMRNICKMEYWESPEGKAEKEYKKMKHSGEAVELRSQEYKPMEVMSVEEYGAMDDFKEYKAAKQHYSLAKANKDDVSCRLWHDVALGNLKSSLAQMDMMFKELHNGTESEDERVAIRDFAIKLYNKYGR